MDRIRLAYVPTRRSVFSRTEAKRQRDIILKHIASFPNVEIVDISAVSDEGLLKDDLEEEIRITNYLKSMDVDAVFAPHCNFGTEDAVARVGRALNKPFLLWGPRDDAPLSSGARLRDTQCGLFATGKILRRFGVPFTYIVNSTVESEVFRRGFYNFIAAANVVKSLKNMRILQIGPRPTAFWTMMCNEGELLERFGIQIIPLNLEEITDLTLQIVRRGSAEFKEHCASMKSRFELQGVRDEALERIVALKMAIEQKLEQYHCQTVAIQCWSTLQDLIGIMPCLTNALLTDEGFPVTCETDVHGAVSALLARAASMGATPPFFADLTIRHPDVDNGELLFHCGNFPTTLSVSDRPLVREHFLFDTHAPGTHEGEIKGGDISVVRFDGDHGDYQLFLGRAKGIQGPFTRGSYLWVEVKDWPLWEERLVTGPYVHHVAGIHANVIPVLYEACKYIPGLQPDPVDPTAEEIQAWLRGGEWSW